MAKKHIHSVLLLKTYAPLYMLSIRDIILE